MADASSTSFQTLPIPQKGIPQTLVGSYRVYKDAKEFVTVKAATALEAFESSGLKEAYKIERERLDAYAVLGVSSWKKDEAAKPEADAAAKPADAAAPQEKPAS